MLDSKLQPIQLSIIAAILSVMIMILDPELCIGNDTHIYLCRNETTNIRYTDNSLHRQMAFYCRNRSVLTISLTDCDHLWV